VVRIGGAIRRKRAVLGLCSAFDVGLFAVVRPDRDRCGLMQAQGHDACRCGRPERARRGLMQAQRHGSWQCGRVKRTHSGLMQAQEECARTLGAPSGSAVHTSLVRAAWRPPYGDSWRGMLHGVPAARFNVLPMHVIQDHQSKKTTCSKLRHGVIWDRERQDQQGRVRFARGNGSDNTIEKGVPKSRRGGKRVERGSHHDYFSFSIGLSCSYGVIGSWPLISPCFLPHGENCGKTAVGESQFGSSPVR
jgi:hypothetical protein